MVIIHIKEKSSILKLFDEYKSILTNEYLKKCSPVLPELFRWMDIQS